MTDYSGSTSFSSRQDPAPHQTESLADAAREGYQSERGPLESQDGRSLGEVMKDLTRNISTLLQQEIALAKAEVKQAGTEAGKGVAMFVGAALAGVLFLVFISLSAAVGLGQFIGAGAQPSGVQWGSLIVAVIWAVVAAALAMAGKKELERVRGVPRTTETLSKVPNALKGQEERNP